MNDALLKLENVYMEYGSGARRFTGKVDLLIANI